MNKEKLKKQKKEIIIFLIQMFMFYIFPLFAGPTDAMGMVIIIIFTTFLLSIIVGVISKEKIIYLYPIICSIIFIPSVFIYYNESALVHSIWYLIISFVGLIIGLSINKLKNVTRCEKSKWKKIIIIVFLLILLIPIPMRLKDGGTVEYRAILYKISKVHRLNVYSETGYHDGLIIEVLGMQIYNNVENNISIKTLEINDVVGDNDLIFSISSGENKNCVPVELVVYDNNKYILYKSYKAGGPGETVNSILEYSEKEEGFYDYDVIKILQNSKDANNMSFDMANLPEYEIYTGKDKHNYITDSNNKYLKEFLDSIDVDLKVCAKEDYS